MANDKTSSSKMDRQQSEDHDELVKLAQSEFTWTRGMTWWGETLPCINPDSHEYEDAAYWTIDRASYLALWLDMAHTEILPYSAPERLLAHGISTIARRNAIQIMKKQTGGRFDLRLYTQIRRRVVVDPGDPEVNQLIDEWVTAMRYARKACIRTPVRLYRQGITPQNAQGNDLATIITYTDMAMHQLVRCEMIRPPPDEIHGQYDAWIEQGRRKQTNPAKEN